MDIQRFIDYQKKVVDNCSKVIVGKDDIISLVLICFVCSGHVLLEDVPGTGKTMLLRAFSKTIGGNFTRIQFTPDLLPSDLTGINFFNQKTGNFEFRRGPLFSNIILADEINRATPRTQSSLLEVMEEQQITVDGTSYTINQPFMVMATQNPIESYGTFPLPEAQKDRFLMRLSLGYMTREQEMTVVSRRSTLDIINSLCPAVTAEQTAYLKEHYSRIFVSEDVLEYLMNIVAGTRSESQFVTGVSTRGAIALYKASQVAAAFLGRDFVMPEDVRMLAPHVLCHRLTSGIYTKKEDAVAFLDRLIEQTPVPLEAV